MTWVKICGITNLEDALVAVDAGADAVGFVFYEKSPRYVSVETAREIVEKLPETVEKVGVFVRPEAEQVARLSNEASLTVAQIYPDASRRLDDEFVHSLRCRVIPAISLAGIGEDEIRGFHLTNGMRERVMAVLVDSGNSELPGGTGEMFDWNVTSAMDTDMRLKLLVAGGLTPRNVDLAIKTLHPWGVDVSSGVEAHRGKKDPEKVRAFVRAVREADRRAS